MAELHGLIKLRRHELDEKRRHLGELNKQLTQLENQRQAIFNRIEREKELAKDDWRTHQSFTIYLKGALQKCDHLAKAIQAVMVKIEKATEVVHEAFREVKKLEITQENREKRAEAERNRRESVMLDEVGIDGWRRKQDDNA